MRWQGVCSCVAGLLTAGCAPAPPAEVAAVDVTPSAKAVAAAVPDDAVAFVYSPEQPGDVCDEHRRTQREMVLKTGTEVRRVSTTLESRVRYVVVEAKNGLSVKERVVYEKYDETSTSQAIPPPPTVKKTYLVSLEQGAIVVHDESGASVSAAERAWMLDHWRVGERETFGDIFDKLVLRPRAQVPGLARRYLERVDKRATIKSQSYEFRGVDADGAWVEISIEGELALPNQPPKAISLDGTVRVSVPRGTILSEDYEFIFPHALKDGDVVSVRERMSYSRTRGRTFAK